MMWNDKPHSSYLIYLSSDFVFFSGETLQIHLLANLKYNMPYVNCFTRLSLDFWNSFILYNWIFVPSDQHLLSHSKFQTIDILLCFMSWALADSTHNWDNTVFSFLCCLIPLDDVLHVHSCYLTWKDVLFWRMNNIHSYMSHFLYLHVW